MSLIYLESYTYALQLTENKARKLRTRRTNQPQRALRDRLARLLARAEDHRIRKVRHARRVRIRPRALLHRRLDASALEGLHRHSRPRGSAYVRPAISTARRRARNSVEESELFASHLRRRLR